MASKSKTTTDHKTIREWVEERGGRPAVANGTRENGGAGVLRIAFDENNDSLQPISWIDFFDKFEKNNLAFLYQEEKADGSESRFFKFVERDKSQVSEER